MKLPSSKNWLRFGLNKARLTIRFEPIYRESAIAMISNAAQKGLISNRSQNRQILEVSLENGKIRFTPDHMETDKDGNRVFRRMKTKRVKTKDDDPVYGLYFCSGQRWKGFALQDRGCITCNWRCHPNQFEHQNRSYPN